MSEKIGCSMVALIFLAVVFLLGLLGNGSLK